MKSELKTKNATPFKLFLRKIASIFIPLIPALVASGLITGISKAVIQAGWLSAESQLAMILTVIGGGLFTYLGILVGINAAKEFGGSPFSVVWQGSLLSILPPLRSFYLEKSSFQDGVDLSVSYLLPSLSPL